MSDPLPTIEDLIDQLLVPAAEAARAELIAGLTTGHAATVAAGEIVPLVVKLVVGELTNADRTLAAAQAAVHDLHRCAAQNDRLVGQLTASKLVADALRQEVADARAAHESVIGTHMAVLTAHAGELDRLHAQLREAHEATGRYVEVAAAGNVEILALRARVAELQEQAAAVHAIHGGERCGSCEHEWGFHQAEGCWFAVVRGTVGRNSVCPCSIAPAAEEVQG